MKFDPYFRPEPFKGRTETVEDFKKRGGRVRECKPGEVVEHFSSYSYKARNERAKAKAAKKREERAEVQS